jgi:hypothetical protein
MAVVLVMAEVEAEGLGVFPVLPEVEAVAVLEF